MLRYALVLLLMFGADRALAQESDSKAPVNAIAEETPAAAPQSDAQRITRLQRTIAENEKLLGDLQAKVDQGPAGEYAKAEAEFEKVDQELTAGRHQADELTKAGKADEAATLRAQLVDLEQRWKLAKDRFDLAIEQRKTLRQQIAALEQKLGQDRAALELLLSPPQPTTQPATSAPVSPVVVPESQAPAQQPAAAAESPPAAPSAAEPVPVATPAKAAARPDSPEVVEAQRKAEAAESEALKAEQESQSVTERIEQLGTAIELERQQLKTARKQAANAQQTQQALSEQAQRGATEGMALAELRELWGRVAEAGQRYREAQADVTERVDRVGRLRDELDQLRADQLAAAQQAERTRAVAEEARARVEWRKSPFHPQNLLRWLVERGPRVAGIILGMLVLLWLSRVLEKRLVRLLVGRADHGSVRERENRAQTLVSVFRNAATLVITIGGVLMIVTEFGVNIVPLVGAAGVIGLAVAFGAQNLVRDYFAGFMILLENQYGINDVVKVGEIGGLVERVTLRVTVLRGLDGTLHFVPNGQITTVSNMTHGWSRALFDIGVAYKEDVDRVMDVLMDLGKQMRTEPEFKYLILDDPEMLGVDSFGDSAVVIKFFIKTRPLQQWTVKRALLRRIKKKFDELGIEIPFPHRTVFQHTTQGGSPPAEGDDNPSLERERGE